ncbi:DUF4340 domain-containing protein [Chloroflexota bacterium]
MRLKNILFLLLILIVLGGVFYYTSRPQPAPPPEPQLFVWLVEMDDIKHIEISLPKENKSQSFIKISEEDKFPWYFDDPQRSNVDAERWGGGIPLLLSGPGADRIISENTSEEKLAEFGLIEPQMEIVLTLENGETLKIKVGDSTPDGHAYYVQAPDSSDVATVDYTWYGVLERLVKEPPYASPEKKD